MDDDENPQPAEEEIDLELMEVVKDVWVVARLLGAGNFGKVYHVINIKSGREGAMKIEKVQVDSVLKMEVEIMKEMRGVSGAIQLFDEGTGQKFTNKYNFVVMTLCGWDLTKISEELHNKFSDSTILRISIRTLNSVKILHEIGYVHRDLKPCNFALDARKEAFKIFLLDFGMARRFARKQESGWIMRAPRSQGRHDDLISWLYMMIELRVALPWRNTSHPAKIEVQKQELFGNTLNKDSLTQTYTPIYAHLQTQTYADRPDYKMIYTTLLHKLQSLGAKLTDPMDYDQIRPCPGQEVQAVIDKYKVPIRPQSHKKSKEDQEMIYFEKAFSTVGIPADRNIILDKNKNFYYQGSHGKKSPSNAAMNVGKVGESSRATNTTASTSHHPLVTHQTASMMILEPTKTAKSSSRHHKHKPSERDKKDREKSKQVVESSKDPGSGSDPKGGKKKFVLEREKNA